MRALFIFVVFVFATITPVIAKDNYCSIHEKGIRNCLLYCMDKGIKYNDFFETYRCVDRLKDSIPLYLRGWKEDNGSDMRPVFTYNLPQGFVCPSRKNDFFTSAAIICADDDIEIEIDICTEETIDVEMYGLISDEEYNFEAEDMGKAETVRRIINVRLFKVGFSDILRWDALLFTARKEGMIPQSAYVPLEHLKGFIFENREECIR